MEWPKIVFFGDSLTRRANDVEEGCWGSMVEAKVGHYFDVDYRGFEGYNTKWAVDLLPKLFPKSYLDKVQILMPFFGHNDSWEPANPLSVPVEDYERNFRTIIKYFLDNGVDKSKIIMVTPNWFHLETFLAFLKTMVLPPSGKTFEDAQKYGEAVKRVARDNDIEVLDMFAISSKHEPLVELYCDGVHYSKKGAAIFFENLFPIIKRKIETAYKKPLIDLLHTPRDDQFPETVAVWGEYRKQRGYVPNRS